ncbi:class I SAM-dependent methyltransferase [Clostridium thermarum]|uniref:class I SAM-dependent methyltransferase n=1 Tax=Clostridium thermarum TaxID=1716543 RepID=UPI0013D709E8|nr:methyltransferase [Clostridium thermarum]
MGHYFINDESLTHNYKTINFHYKNRDFKFTTDSGVFSKNHVDEGTTILLNNLPELRGKVLDLGCGYGCIGISLKMTNDIDLTMADINERALELAALNCKNNGLNNISIIQSDGFSNISDKFDFIILNPPIRAGKKTIFKLYEDSYQHLNKHGKFIFVINKKHGAESSIEKVNEIFNDYEILYKKKGWYVISCELI